MDKTKARRALELIVLAAIVACVALVLVELAGNVRAEVSIHRLPGVAPTDSA